MFQSTNVIQAWSTLLGKNDIILSYYNPVFTLKEFIIRALIWKLSWVLTAVTKQPSIRYKNMFKSIGWIRVFRSPNLFKFASLTRQSDHHTIIFLAICTKIEYFDVLLNIWIVSITQQIYHHTKQRILSWWRHQMEIFSALMALCAGNLPLTGEFPAQRPVTCNFDVFFDLRLNKRFSRQSWGWWFETPSLPLLRHCNVYLWYVMKCKLSFHTFMFIGLQVRKLERQARREIILCKGVWQFSPKYTYSHDLCIGSWFVVF